MPYVLAIVAGIVGAVVGWFVTALITLWVAGEMGVSDFEGGRGMLAFLGIGPIGGLIAMVVSAWLALRVAKGGAALGPTVARLAAVLGGIALLVAAGLGVRLLMVDTYSDTLPPTLEFELRIPAETTAPEVSATQVELHTDRNVQPALLHQIWADEEGGHVLRGQVELAFKTSSRLLMVALPGEPRRLYRLRLGRDPAATDAPSAWQRADHLDDPGEAQPRPAPPDDPVELRFRVSTP